MNIRIVLIVLIPLIFFGCGGSSHVDRDMILMEIGEPSDESLSDTVTVDNSIMFDGNGNTGEILDLDAPQDVVQEYGATAIVGPSGGTVAVENPSDPLYGVVVEIPPGALLTDVEIRISSGADARDLPEGFFQVSPVVNLGPEGTWFQEPVFLTIHLQSDLKSLSDVPVIMVRSENESAWGMLTTTAVDTERNTVVVRTVHFSSVVGADANPPMAWNSDYKPNDDGFFCLNSGMPPACSDGACMGFSAFSVWYYLELMGSYGHLATKFHVGEDPFSAAGCAETREIACDAWSSYAVYNSGKTVWDALTNLPEMSAWWVFSSVKKAIWAKKAPVVITGLAGSLATGFTKHALVAYGWDDTNLYLYDPSSPSKETVLTKQLLGWKPYMLGSYSFTRFNTVSNEEFQGFISTYWDIFTEHELSACPDLDGDGRRAEWCGGDDCNDDDFSVYPGATELCNGRDDNCDGKTDDEWRSCPNGMVSIDSCVCIDAYEASRPLASATDDAFPGYNKPSETTDIPQSKLGVLPWGHITWAGAKAACERADKRLCGSTEWRKACHGPANLAYPYGAAYVAKTCNDGKPDEPLDVKPTGSYPGCRSGFGTFDQSGNAPEWVVGDDYLDQDPIGTIGGAYNSTSVPTLGCNGPVFGWMDDYRSNCEKVTIDASSGMPMCCANALGFRCCVGAAP